MSVFSVTNTLLHRAYAAKDDADLSPLRVQALLYLLHGWYMAIVGSPLLPTSFVAGKYGPILPELASELEAYGGNPVDEYIHEFDTSTYSLKPFFVNEAAFPQFREILEQVWSVYRPLTTVQLRGLSNDADSPWAKTEPGKPIPNALIRDNFLERARQSTKV